MILFVQKLTTIAQLAFKTVEKLKITETLRSAYVG